MYFCKFLYCFEADFVVRFFLLVNFSLFGGVIISKEVKVNKEIRARQVRVIGENGEQLGILHIKEALRAAEERSLDLVEVSPATEPPVCKRIQNLREGLLM